MHEISVVVNNEIEKREFQDIIVLTKIFHFRGTYCHCPLTMGAYLSEPITEKQSVDEKLDHLVYGASAMQGWRLSQEVGISHDKLTMSLA